MKIALLGDTGFVGQNVAKVLKESGLSFVGASRKNGVDLRDIDQCRAYFEKEKPDVIINCAAHVGSLNYVTEQAAQIMLNNSRMILSMYEAVAEKCPQAIIINPIANCAYPAKADLFTEDSWWDGHLHRSVLPYGATRRFLWTVAESFAMQYGVRSINLFVPNMYGPYDSTDPNKAHALNALISKFVKAEKEGNASIEIWGTGIAIREWLYAEDFGKIILSILKDNCSTLGLSEPTNIAQNFGLSVKELVGIIQKNFTFSGKIEWDTTKPDGAPKKVMDDRRFRKVFPEFNFTPLDKGIKETIKYYESIYPY